MTSWNELGGAWGVAVPDLEAGTNEGGAAGGAAQAEAAPHLRPRQGGLLLG